MRCQFGFKEKQIPCKTLACEDCGDGEASGLRGAIDWFNCADRLGHPGARLI
ncbi:MAG: hypothetical protein AAFR26_23310 [Cyanobacteria bacterium J06626_4]